MREDVSAVPAEENQFSHKIKYVGDVGELLPIVLVNFMFTILTLGIYRFWAKTNIRQYLWSNTHFDDEPFEYTGTGGELFMGALIVFLILMPMTFGIVYAMGHFSKLYPEVGPFFIVALYPLMLFLVGIALYRAQVYRMSRTSWRGIRGAQLPGSRAYGWLTLKYAVLYFISFGLLAPYIICRMWNFVMNNKRMGSGVFQCDVKSKPLFKVWIITWLGAIATLGGLGTAMYFALMSQQVGLFVLCYLLTIVAIVGVFIWFQAALSNHLLHGLRFQNIQVNFDISVKDMFIVSFVNFMILMISLGLGSPFITQRWIRIISERTTFSGQLDFSEIAQSPEVGPRFGEGLVEAFDIG